MGSRANSVSWNRARLGRCLCTGPTDVARSRPILRDDFDRIVLGRLRANLAELAQTSVIFEPTLDRNRASADQFRPKFGRTQARLVDLRPNPVDFEPLFDEG